MKYYQILNCTKEPFPGQPTAELFYAAAPHEACLNSLCALCQEDKHSFHIVIGEPGSGKTTLFFQFQKKIKADLNITHFEIASHKYFSNKKVFLANLKKSLGIANNENTTSENDTEQRLLIEIKTFLRTTRQGNQKKIIILFDQAEKIPSYCLEILDAIFDSKPNPAMIQFVLFAPPSFIKKISLYSNLSQNSNIIHLAKKLSFADCKELLNHYLVESGTNRTLHSLITTAGMYNLYIISGGNPGRLLDLFRLTMINQIIQNRTKAGSLLCYQSAKEIFPERVLQITKIKYATLAVAGLLFIGLITMTGQRDDTYKIASPPENIQTPASTPIPSTSSPEITGKQQEGDFIAAASQPEISDQKHVIDILDSLQKEGEQESKTSQLQKVLANPNKEPESVIVPQEKPQQLAQPSKEASSDTAKETRKEIISHLPTTLGTITVFEEETLGDMIRRIYGPFSFTQANIEKVLAQNNHIRNKHSLNVGDKLTFPTMNVEISENEIQHHWLHLVTIDTLQDAYRYLRIYASKDLPLMMIPSMSEQNKIQFNIVLEESYATKQEAHSKLEHLSKDFFPTASILDGLNPALFYFDTKRPETTKDIALVIIPKKIKKANNQELPILTTTNNKVIKSSQSKGQPSVQQKAETSKVLEIKATQAKEAQSFLGKLQMPKATTLGHMIRAIYGKNSVNKVNISWLLTRNRHIKDPDELQPGTWVNFPPKNVRLPKDSASAWWISMGSFKTLQEAYHFLFTNTKEKPWLLIIPIANSSPLEFTVFVEQFFENETLASGKMSALTDDGFHGLAIIHELKHTDYSFEELK